MSDQEDNNDNVVVNNGEEGGEIIMANPVRGISLSEFHGDPTVDKMSVKAWIAQVDACATLANWDDNRTASFALMSLRGKAMQWSINQQQADPDKFNAWAGAGKLKLSLQARFWYSRTFSERNALKQSLVQTVNMSCRDFMDLCETVSYQLMETEWEDVQLLADGSNQAQVTQDGLAKAKHHKLFIMGAFAAGLRDEIKAQIGVTNPLTPHELLEISTRIEANILDKNKQIRDQSNLEVHALMGRKFRLQNNNNSTPQNNDVTCWSCGKIGHISRFCRQGQNYTRGKSFQGRFRFRGNNRGGRGNFSNRGGRQNGNNSFNKVAEISTEPSLTPQNAVKEENMDARSENDLFQGQAAATLLNPYFL